MRKRIVVLGFLLSQTAAMFANVEDAQVVVADTDAVVVAEPVVPETPAIPDSVISEDNDLIELDKQKPLPEYRWTTIGVSVSGGASWYNSNPANNRNAPCIRAGLNFDVPIGQYFSLQPELLFAVRGGGFKVISAQKVKGEMIPFENTLKENLFYFDVPINCKFSKRMNLSRVNTGRGFISAGPVLSLGVYGTSEGSATGTKNKLFQNDPDKETEHGIYRNFDFSFNFRLGYDFDAGYTFAAGYQLGVCNLMNDNKFTDADNRAYKPTYFVDYPTVKNNSLYVSVGYRW